MRNPFRVLFGARPRETLIWIFFSAIFVGALMAIFHMSPFELFDRVIDIIEELLADHLYLLRQILRYFVYGLIVVIPIWIVMRLINLIR